MKIWNLANLWNLKSLNPSEISKFEILNPRHTKFPIWTTKISLNFDEFWCYKFEENFTEIDKINPDNPKFDEITKFEFNPKP